MTLHIGSVAVVLCLTQSMAFASFYKPKLEGRRLTIEISGGERKWDLLFNEDARSWDGSLFENGVRAVRLERPNPGYSISNPLVGDWAAQPDDGALGPPPVGGCLHGVPRPNGELVLWLDRETTREKSYGQRLGNAYVEGNDVHLVLPEGIRPPYLFTGVLSGNNEKITGNWSPNWQYPGVFVRVESGPCAL